MPRTNRTTQRARASPSLTWQEAFLIALSRIGTVSGACKTVVRGGKCLARRTVYDERDTNPEFRQRWDDVQAVTIDKLELAMKSRAAQGWLEPVWFKGKRCGTVRKFSDQLQIFMLSRLRRDTYGQDVTALGAASPREYAERVRSALDEMDGGASDPETQA